MRVQEQRLRPLGRAGDHRGRTFSTGCAAGYQEIRTYYEPATSFSTSCEGSRQSAIRSSLTVPALRYRFAAGAPVCGYAPSSSRARTVRNRCSPVLTGEPIAGAALEFCGESSLETYSSESRRSARISPGPGTTRGSDAAPRKNCPACEHSTALRRANFASSAVLGFSSINP